MGAKRTNGPRRDDGYSLVELLVVILVIGLLAGIAIPTFLSHRDKSYDATMRSDLRAIIAAQFAYIADHDAPTDDPSALEAEGFRQTQGVTPKVQVTATAFIACVKHTNAPDWLVYNSVTGAYERSSTPCA